MDLRWLSIDVLFKVLAVIITNTLPYECVMDSSLNLGKYFRWSFRIVDPEDCDCTLS